MAYPARTGGRLGNANALGARSLGTLTLLERHGLSFAQLVEARLPAGGVVEEVLGSVICQDETKPFVADEPLDGAVHRCCHTLSFKKRKVERQVYAEQGAPNGSKNEWPG